jgi:hypothetical protein
MLKTVNTTPNARDVMPSIPSRTPVSSVESDPDTPDFAVSVADVAPPSSTPALFSQS